MSKIELDPWQDPTDGFPTDAYRDAVMAALEKAGVRVHDYWRDERWDFNFELDRAAFDAGDFPPGTQDLIIGWRVGEESEPLEARPDDSWRGFEAVGQVTAWHYVPCKDSGVGHYVRELCHPDYPNSPINPLAEPAEVAAAVAALVRGGSVQEATKVICRDCGLPVEEGPGRRDTRHDHCGPLPHTGPVGGPYCEKCG